MTSIKISALTDIGSNIAYTTLVPVVSTTGTYLTQQANLQIVGNLVLNGAGGSYFPPAAQAVLAQSVTNAAQGNITSVGTLTSLTVSGNITVANINAVAIKLTPVTFANLPSADTLGLKAFITDANTLTYGSIVSGGGANNTPVFADGTNWRIG